METKDTCLYIHTRKDDGGIFYVGIGDKKRPYTTKNRNRHWYNVVKKHDYDIIILKTGMSWEEACNLEIKMIAFYGRIKPSKNNLNYGCLVNQTDGGNGAKGAVWSDEAKKKRSELNIKNGNRRPSRKGMVWTDESKKKISGGNNPMFGKTHTEETKKKMTGKNHSRSRKVICSVTGNIYACIREAAENNGINYGRLKDYLLGRSRNKTSLRYL